MAAAVAPSSRPAPLFRQPEFGTWVQSYENTGETMAAILLLRIEVRANATDHHPGRPGSADVPGGGKAGRGVGEDARRIVERDGGGSRAARADRGSFRDSVHR